MCVYCAPSCRNHTTTPPNHPLQDFKHHIEEFTDMNAHVPCALFPTCASSHGMRVLQDFKHHIDEFTDMHAGVFLGFKSQRQLPTSYGLRDLWEKPVLNATLFADIR